MQFKVAFIAHAPDALPEKHRSVIETGKYKLTTVVVANQGQALAACKQLLETDGLHSVLLCPGFTHRDVADISAALGKDVGVVVARGDGPSGRATADIMKQAGWFS